jgi:tetrahydromethanopterin S-methyltransferase subunit G
MSDEQLIGESVGCDLNKCYGVVIGTSALYFGGQARDS